MLARGLDPARYESSAAVIREGWMHDALRGAGVATTITRTGRGPVDLGYLWQLGRLMRRQRTHIVQSHLLTATLYSALAGRLAGVPVVGTFHGMVDLAPKDRWATVKLRLITANVARLVFVSEALRHHFQARYRISDARVSVISNGIDPAVFRPAPHRGLQQELHLPDDAILIGAVGNIRPAKGYDDLLRVARICCRADARIHFVIVGEPGEPLQSSLMELRREFALESRVTFLGFRSDIAWILNGVDIYLSTSTSEGFSLTTIQAMASALPVIATRSGGPEEIITDGEDGMLVPVGDVDGIAREVLRLLADGTLRTRLAAKGVDTVATRFTAARMTAAYERVYEDALSGRVRTGAT
jgi:glycosyltransferase involved in cell wall biosynthesis